MNAESMPRTKSTTAPLQRLLATPEPNLAFFSFVFHFVWEIVQVPAYAGMSTISHWQGVLICLKATIGDVGIVLAAFWAIALLLRNRNWLGNPQWIHTAGFTALGVAITVVLEFIYVHLTGRWIYSDAMILVPPFGTGLTPLLQWMVIPPLTVFVVWRQIRPVDLNDGHRKN